MTTACAEAKAHGFEVEVTQEHISGGEPDSLCECPLAHAIQDGYPGPGRLLRVEVATGETRITVTDGVQVSRTVYRHSKAVRDWLKHYDDVMTRIEPVGDRVEPKTVGPMKLEFDRETMEVGCRTL